MRDTLSNGSIRMSVGLSVCDRQGPKDGSFRDFRKKRNYLRFFSNNLCTSKTFSDHFQNFTAYSSFNPLSNGTIRVSVGLSVRDRQVPKAGLFSRIYGTVFSAIFMRRATHEGSIRSARDFRTFTYSKRRSERAYPQVSSPIRSETVLRP